MLTRRPALPACSRAVAARAAVKVAPLPLPLLPRRACAARCQGREQPPATAAAEEEPAAEQQQQQQHPWARAREELLRQRRRLETARVGSFANFAEAVRQLGKDELAFVRSLCKGGDAAAGKQEREQ